ncbi:thioredoxin-like 3-2, chloroplastic isoform X2 [Lycium ferocissimum]|uniref:thioredoxin-like 3-2, chloroplastic isoform X2 n=1 Tax=Lycium ferocissimum TaxID=112874 RepID=UPI002814F07A|nr:thioredoxin-like 3-2, chloroplastic isoform X2 [Lycium ferocissimum]
MSSSIKFSPVIQQLLHPRKSNPSSISTLKVPRLLLLPPISLNCSKIHLDFRVRAEILENQENLNDDSPASVELQPVCSEPEFDRVIADAQQLDESVVILWKASWCRKCIYLKPKLERLAADYFPRTRFYSVDVNNVPHKLVVRAGITLWRDGKKQAEIIGGHKAYVVVSEVRDMIENQDNL